MPEKKLFEYAELIESEFLKLIPVSDFKIAQAMLYSLESGGKRIRPSLLLEFCRVYGGDLSGALPSAAALEFIHTFSLIHDDLPCMDNDDFRRGKPSCHRAFPEPIALLAGDALAIAAFGIIADNKRRVDSDRLLKVVGEFSKAAGVSGMIGGQELDMPCETSSDENKLLKMYSLKTAALFETACRCGCVLAGADDAAIENAGLYAGNLALAFQLIDDILDLESDAKTIGRNTYASVFGVGKTRKKAGNFSEKALNFLENVPDNDFLVKLTNKLLNRSF